MLIYSLVIMGVATFLIGVLPTYASIGVWAPILLVVLRCGQGIGVGGEWGGAVLMAVEHSPKGRRGLAGSWPQMGVPAGLFLSTVVFGLFSTQLTDAQFLSWGWRVPFLLSAALVVVGLFIRLKILETPAFTALQQTGRRETRPLMTAVRDYRRSMLLAMGMRVAENGLFYVYTVFVLTYGPARLGLSRGTDAVGRHARGAGRDGGDPVATARSPIALAAGRCISSARRSRLPTRLPFFWLLDLKSPAVAWVAIVLGVVLGHDAMYGPQAAYFSELFGSSVRYSGASVSYQLSSVVTGGLAPFIATALLASWGSRAVAAYMMLLAAITIVATYLAPETYRTDIST